MRNIEVKATREGRIGSETASGWIVDRMVPAVALPSVRALYRCVAITNPRNGRTVSALVLDVGPWNEHDDAYVFGTERPLAESGLDERGRETNGAGIDLSEWVWHALGMKDNGLVFWRFLD